MKQFRKPGERARRPGSESAAPFLPERISLRSLTRAAEDCRGCHLYRRATRTVFGEGLVRSRLMLVGEMPGDREDREGRPFVGPAGRVLDDALAGVGIDRADACVTNVVKHFKWERRGKRRLHQAPTQAEVRACLPWFDAEVEVIEPEVIVALGAMAARALLGPDVRVSRQRAQAERLLAVWRAPTGWRRWSAVNNHKVGIWYTVGACAFFLFGGLLALLMRVQLASPGNEFLSAELYNQVFTLHGSVMMFLFAVPVFEAFEVRRGGGSRVDGRLPGSCPDSRVPDPMHLPGWPMTLVRFAYAIRRSVNAETRE